MMFDNKDSASYNHQTIIFYSKLQVNETINKAILCNFGKKKNQVRKLITN